MLASAAPTPEKSTLRQEIASALSDAADRLPKPLRDVFALCAFSGLSLKEAAAVLGLTVSATKTRLFRAHERMRSHLQPVWSDMRIHGYRELPDFVAPSKKRPANWPLVSNRHSRCRSNHRRFHLRFQISLAEGPWVREGKARGERRAIFAEFRVAVPGASSAAAAGGRPRSAHLADL
jgi:hypothetical protein